MWDRRKERKIKRKRSASGDVDMWEKGNAWICTPFGFDLVLWGMTFREYRVSHKHTFITNSVGIHDAGFLSLSSPAQKAMRLLLFTLMFKGV